MRIVLAIRVFLGLILLVDLPAVLQIVFHFFKGGPSAVNRWVAHVALEGTPLFLAGADQQQHQIDQAYLVFTVMILVMPLALYFLQRWLKTRIKNQ